MGDALRGSIIDEFAFCIKVGDWWSGVRRGQWGYSPNDRASLYQWDDLLEFSQMHVDAIMMYNDSER